MRLLLLHAGIFICAVTSSINAQNSYAPDFTETDINGVTHSLYADYLDQGKYVILDFSTTWCGPCWRFHGFGHLEHFYEIYGIEEDDAQVFLMECDPSTGMADLMGNTTQTTGDWITGTPYPIIDLATTAIPDAYDIWGYPTIVVVCPDGIRSDNFGMNPLYYANIVDHEYLADFAYNLCSESNNNVIDARAVNIDGSPNHCNVDYTGQVKIRNQGTGDITNLNYELVVDGNSVGVQQYNTPINAGEFALVPYGPLTLSNTSNVAIEITDVNGAPDENLQNNTTDKDITGTFVDAGPFGDFTLDVRLDYPCWQLGWELYDDNLNLMDSEFEYNNGDPSDIRTYSLDTGCYTIKAFDVIGDGFDGTDGYVLINDQGDELFHFNPEGFVDYKSFYVRNPTMEEILETNDPIGVPSAFSPNADGNNDVLYVEGMGVSKIDFKVFNQYGEMVFQSGDIEHGWDGTYKGAKENPGVFAYVLEYTFIDGKNGLLKGDVTLVK